MWSIKTARRTWFFLFRHTQAISCHVNYHYCQYHRFVSWKQSKNEKRSIFCHHNFWSQVSHSPRKLIPFLPIFHFTRNKSNHNFLDAQAKQTENKLFDTFLGIYNEPTLSILEYEPSKYNSAVDSMRISFQWTQAYSMWINSISEGFFSCSPYFNKGGKREQRNADDVRACERARECECKNAMTWKGPQWELMCEKEF